MIFFRSHTVPLQIKDARPAQAAKTQRLFFIQIKASFEGQVDPLSGMVVNLVDIDRWVKTVADGMKPVRGPRDFVLKFFEALKAKSVKLVEVELSHEHRKIRFDGENWSWFYLAQAWVMENSKLISREVWLESAKPLSRKWLVRFGKKKWSQPEKLALILRLKSPQIRSVELKKPETGLSLKFQ